MKTKTQKKQVIKLTKNLKEKNFSEISKKEFLVLRKNAVEILKNSNKKRAIRKLLDTSCGTNQDIVNDLRKMDSEELFENFVNLRFGENFNDFLKSAKTVIKRQPICYLERAFFG